MKRYVILLPVVIIFFPPVLIKANEVMAGKMFLQVIALSIVSILAGIQNIFKLSRHENMSVTFIIFFAGSITFWMIPRSVDLSAQNMPVNYLMLSNLFLAGYLLGTSLKAMPFVLKTAIIIYGLSMVLTMGMIYYVSTGLLCAVYSIEMQKITGKYILQFFPLLFILFMFSAGKSLRNLANKTKGV